MSTSRLSRLPGIDVGTDTFRISRQSYSGFTVTSGSVHRQSGTFRQRPPSILPILKRESRGVERIRRDRLNTT